MHSLNSTFEQRNHLLINRYHRLNRKQWMATCNPKLLSLTISKAQWLKKINREVKINEVTDIYLPLAHWINFYINHTVRRQTLLKNVFNTKATHATPYIISISGSVASGKSTTARLLQDLLLINWQKYRRVELISTDSFLHPNNILKKRGLMKKKGFPLSYDRYSLIKFISDLKSGVSKIKVPIYSHMIYDRIPDTYKTIMQPDILILEGLNTLQNEKDYLHHDHNLIISDFVDFSIYIDAPEELLQTWYIKRFLKFCEEALINPYSYFCSYTHLSKRKVINIATSLWQEINYINLKENILPTRERADLIIAKSEKHLVDQIYLKK